MPARAPATAAPDDGAPPHDDAIYVGVKDMARMIGLSMNECYRLLDRRQVASVVYGRRRLVDVASLRDFAASLPTERAG